MGVGLIFLLIGGSVLIDQVYSLPPDALESPPDPTKLSFEAFLLQLSKQPQYVAALREVGTVSVVDDNPACRRPSGETSAR